MGAAPDDGLAATALTRLSEGVAAMPSGSGTEWPFGAILPWNKSQTLWHAWAAAVVGTTDGDVALDALLVQPQLSPVSVDGSGGSATPGRVRDGTAAV